MLDDAKYHWLQGREVSRSPPRCVSLIQTKQNVVTDYVEILGLDVLSVVQHVRACCVRQGSASVSCDVGHRRAMVSGLD